jgi:hypothetical protein
MSLREVANERGHGNFPEVCNLYQKSAFSLLDGLNCYR